MRWCSAPALPLPAAGRGTQPERKVARARRELDLAAAAAGDAERHGRYVQAAQALGSAARIMDALAGAIALAEPAQGPVINFGAPGHPAVFAPGPR